jgi:hypothetical protein
MSGVERHGSCHPVPATARTVPWSRYTRPLLPLREDLGPLCHSRNHVSLISRGARGSEAGARGSGLAAERRSVVVMVRNHDTGPRRGHCVGRRDGWQAHVAAGGRSMRSVPLTVPASGKATGSALRDRWLRLAAPGLGDRVIVEFAAADDVRSGMARVVAMLRRGGGAGRVEWWSPTDNSFQVLGCSLCWPTCSPVGRQRPARADPRSPTSATTSHFILKGKSPVCNGPCHTKKSRARPGRPDSHP